MLTGVLVELDEELGEEAGGAHDDEGRVGGIAPEKGREPVEERAVEVVCDDDGEGGEPRGVRVEHGGEGPGVGAPLDAVVELCEEPDGLGRSVLADAVEAVEEEVVPRVGIGDVVVVEEGEVADAGEDEVLEDGGGRGACGHDEHPRGLEGCLSARCPESGGCQRGHWALGGRTGAGGRSAWFCRPGSGSRWWRTRCPGSLGRPSWWCWSEPVTMAQYGDLATQLVLEARRSTANDMLLKYNGELVRSIIREQRELDRLADTPDVTPAMLIFQTAILRNKRCLLAYHRHRLDRLRDMYWAVGGALPHLLSNPDIRSKLSPHEVDFLRGYGASVMDYRAGFSNELDITASITHPPKDLHVLVRVVRDCGVIQTELGSIDFQKGQRFMVRRADIEHLIVQGYLEQL